MSLSIAEVALGSGALTDIRRELTLASDGLETGGILLGEVVDGVAQVKHAGDPGPRAIRTRDSFLRDRQHAQALADEAFAADGSIWIGEWHSHVGAAPIPSERDLRTYLALLSDPELKFEHFVSLIAGVVAQRTVMVAWVCDLHDAREVPILVPTERSTTGESS